MSNEKWPNRASSDLCFSLQGTKVSNPGTDPFGLGTNISYSGYGLFESSQESSFSSNSSNSFLPPVPSLPGLAAPDGSESATPLKLVKACTGARHSLSPVQHRVWQQAQLSAQHIGSIPSYALPDSCGLQRLHARVGQEVCSTSKRELIQTGRLSSPRQTSNKHSTRKQQQMGHSQQPAVPLSQSLIHTSRRFSTGQTYLSERQQQPRHSGSAQNTSRARFCSSAQQQVPVGREDSINCVAAGSQHLTTIVLPAGVVSGLDAVKYFASGAGKQSDMIYCNVASCRNHSSGRAHTQESSAAASHCSTSDSNSKNCSCATCHYNPYDLVAVPQQDADKLQHFIVSCNGVIHMSSGEPPDMTTHAEWLRQAEMFSILKQLPFFKQHRTRVAFCTWHSNTKQQRFCNRAAKLGDLLLMQHAGARSAIQRVHILLSAYLSDGSVGQQALLLGSSMGSSDAQNSVEATPEDVAGAQPAAGRLKISASSVEGNVAAASLGNLPASESKPKLGFEPSSAAAAPANGETLAATEACTSGVVEASVNLSDDVQLAHADYSSVGASACLQTVWKKSAATGRWKLQVQHSRKLREDRSPALAVSTPAMQQHDGLNLLQDCQHVNLPGTAAAGPVTDSAAGSKAQGGLRSALANAAESMLDSVQGKVLELLSSITQVEGPMTLTDLAAWRSNTQPAVAAVLAQLHTQIRECLQQLEHELNVQWLAEQAAAAAAEQEVRDSGRKPPLPWNEPTAYNSSQQHARSIALLSRVASVVDVLATSCAAQVAAAATARFLESALLPWDASTALRLCPQQYRPMLRQASMSMQKQPGGAHVGWRGAMQLKVQAKLQEVDMLLQGQQQQGNEAMLSCLRLHPRCDELMAAIGSLPSVLASMLNSLPCMSNEPCVKVWKQQAGHSKAVVTAAPCKSNPQPGMPAGKMMRLQHQQCARQQGGRNTTVLSREAGSTGTYSTDSSQAAGDSCQLQVCVTRGSRSLKARNARLEVLLAACGALEVQAAVPCLLHQHFTTTFNSPQLQPVRDATPLVLLCSSFDAIWYMQSQLMTAHTLAADLAAVASWLAHLANSTSNSLSLAPSPASQSACSSDVVGSHDATFGPSGDGSCHGGSIHSPGTSSCGSDSANMQAADQGLVVIEVGAVRSAMLRMAGATLGSLLKQLQPAFMQLKQALLSQLNDAITTLQQRPDTLDPFTAWLDAVKPHLLPGVAAALGGSERTTHGVKEDGCGIVNAGCDRTYIMREFEALRALLEVMRNGCGSSLACVVGGSTALMRPGSVGSDVRETAAAALRSLTPAVLRSSATALSELQARIMAYKDASKMAGGYATAGAKSLAPDMAANLSQARQDAVQLLVELRTGDCSKAGCPPDQALQHIAQLLERRAQLLQQARRKLQAAGMFREQAVTAAVQAFRDVDSFLASKAADLHRFRTAQMDYTSQLDVLHSTPATSDTCQQLLQQLQRCSSIMLELVQQVEAVSPGSDVCSTAVATAEEMSLAACVRLELAAWQARLPLGALLTGPAVKQHHRLMLLLLMALAENVEIADAESSSELSSLPENSPLRGVAAHQLKQRPSTSAMACSPNTATILSACQHYGLVKADGYQDVFLPNSAAQCGTVDSDESPAKAATHAGATIKLNPCAAPGSMSCISMGRLGVTSIADLLVWLSRSGQTAAVLQQVLDIAKQEEQLAQQVAAADAKLAALSLELSASRVVGCFMLTNLPQLINRLLNTEGQLQAISKHWCHHGVAEHLSYVQALQQNMLGAVQACHDVQTQLLCVHNIVNHPALADCITAQHREAVAAAVKAWAPAMLQIRSAGVKGRGKCQMSAACQDNLNMSVHEHCSGGSVAAAAAANRASSAADKSGGHHSAKLQGCSLLQHVGTLAAAARKADVLTRRARALAAAAIIPALQDRWPRLALVPSEALLQVLEQLPCIIRVAAAGQPVHLPLPLMDVMFRGVTSIVPSQSCQAQGLQHGTHTGRQQAASTVPVSQGTRIPAKSGKLPPVSANTAEVPSTAASIHITSSSGAKELGLRDPHACAEFETQTVSGSLFEPLSAAELARLGSCFSIGALACGGTWNHGPNDQLSAGEKLPLYMLQSSQQSQLPRYKGAACARQQEAQLPQLPKQHGASGPCLSTEYCPAAMLQALHAAAAAVLRHQTCQAIQTAGQMLLQDWAGSFCRQALLLADSVVWTRAATAALQQLDAGNSRALRALADSAVLQLEAVANVLKQNTLRSVQSESGSSAKRGAGTAAQVLVEHGSEKDLRQQAPPSHQQTMHIEQQNNVRPATPDPSEALLPSITGFQSKHKRCNQQMVERHSSSSDTGSVAGTETKHHHQPTSPVVSATAPGHSHLGTCRGTDGYTLNTSHGREQLLSAQQLSGLQLLISAASCHKEAAAALVSESAKGPAAFVWGQQLRHYWQADEGQLQVCFGPYEAQYEWQYCPAATCNLMQPLAAGLLSATSLTAAAAAALAVPPLVGLDVSSWAHNSTHVLGGIRHQMPQVAEVNQSILQDVVKHQQLAPAVVVPFVPDVVDVLGVLLGRFVSHFKCCSSTSSRAVEQWLLALEKAAALSSRADVGADANLAGYDSSGVYGSITELDNLAPGVLAAFSRGIGSIQARMQQRMQLSAAGKAEQSSNNDNAKLKLPLGSCYVGSSSRTSSLAVFCQLPDRVLCSADAATAGTSVSSLIANEVRVSGTLQRRGRCLAVQPPSLPLVLECGLRQLGLLDCSGAAAMLAGLLQQAAEMRSCHAAAAVQEPHDARSTAVSSSGVAATAAVVDDAADANMPGNHQVQHDGADAFVTWSAVRQQLQHLTGLQLQGLPALQPSCTAWAALRYALHACVLPQLGHQQRTVLAADLEAGLLAAQRAGRITGPVPDAMPLAAVQNKQPPCKQQPAQVPCSAGLLPSEGKANSGSPCCIHQWTTDQVAATVREICSFLKRQGCRNVPHSNSKSSNTIASAAADLPALTHEATAEAVGALNAALSLHGGCFLVAPGGIGKTLAWRSLSAAYKVLAGVEAPPVFVHCCAQTLVEQATAIAKQCSGQEVADVLLQLLQKSHAAAVQLERCKILSERLLLGSEDHASELTQVDKEATIADKEAVCASSCQSVLVLDVEVLQGPLLDLLQQQLLQHAQRSSCSPSHASPIWWQIPGCVGCIIECTQVDSTGSMREVLQMLPVVTIQPPGLVDAKRQLWQELNDAFAPMAVVPQSKHASCRASAAVNVSSEGGRSYTHCSASSCSTFQCSGSEAQQDMEQRQSKCSDVTVAVSSSMIDSLAALLQDLIGAGLSAAGSAYGPVHARKLSSSNSDCDARATCWEASRQLMSCCRDAIKLAAAMWKQTSPCPAASSCSLSDAQQEADQRENGSYGCSQEGMDHGANALLSSAPPADVLAAQLLVFCASWVVAGHCGRNNMSLLKEVLTAVLAGAGFTSAAPPASAGGLFGSRLDLSTGHWVTWEQDVQAMHTGRQRDGFGAHICAMPAAYDSRRSSCDQSNTNSMCSTWRPGRLFMASPSTCALQHLIHWFVEAGLNPLLVAQPCSGVKVAVRQLFSHTGYSLARGAFSTAPCTEGSRMIEHQLELVGAKGDMRLIPVPASTTAGHLGGLLLDTLQHGVQQSLRTPAPAGSVAPCLATAGAESSRWSVRFSSSSAGGTTWRSHQAPMTQQDGNVLPEADQDNGTAAVASSAAAAVSTNNRLLWYVEDIAASMAAQSSGASQLQQPDSLEWFRQVLETCSGLASSVVQPFNGTDVSTACAVRVVQVGQAQLLVILQEPGAEISSAAPQIAQDCVQQPSLCDWKLSRRMLLFNVECLSIIAEVEPLAHLDCPGSASHGKKLQQKLSSVFSARRLNMVDSNGVLAALIHQYSSILPGVRDVPKAQVLQGLNAVWLGLAAAVQNLQRHKHLPCSCRFDMRHFRSSLERLVHVLSEHIALLDTNRALVEQPVAAEGSLNPAATALRVRPGERPTAVVCGASPGAPGSPCTAKSPCSPDLATQQSTSSIWNMPVATPMTPYSPLNPYTPRTPGWGIDSPVQVALMPCTAHSATLPAGLMCAGLGIRRLPLKAMCCAVLEVLCRCLTDGAAVAAAADERALQRVVLLLVVQHLALLDQRSQVGQGTASSLASGGIGGGNLLTEMMVAGRRDAAGSKAAGDSSWLQQSLMDLLAVDSSADGTNCRLSSTEDAWQQLQQLPETAFADKLRAAVLPLVLPGRMLAQLVQIASLGRDPVSSLEPLQLAAAQNELAGLLDQHVLLTAAQTSFSSHEPCQGGHATSGAAPTLGRPAEQAMQAAHISCATRLLPCTAFLSAAHKLMWWLQECSAQGSRPSSCCSAADAAACSTALPAMQAPASVAMLSGCWLPGLHAVAACAAAALGVPSVQLQPPTSGRPSLEEQLLQAVITAGVVLGTTVPGGSDAETHHIQVSAADSVSNETACDPTAVTDAAPQVMSPSKLLLAVLDAQALDAAGDMAEVLRFLRRWSSQQPCCCCCCYPEAAAAQSPYITSILQQQQQEKRGGNAQRDLTAGATGCSVSMCIVVLCHPSQCKRTLASAPALQQQAYQLALPVSQVAEQLAADCKAQLMSNCGWAILEHVRDAQALTRRQQQQQQQRLLDAIVCKNSDDQSERQEGLAAASNTELRACQGAEAAAPALAAESAARHIADQLAATMATIHGVIYDAYHDYYGNCGNDGASRACGSSYGDHFLGNGSANVSHSSGSNGRRLQATVCADIAMHAAGNAVPLSKPFDVLQLLPELLMQGRTHLVTRRAALTTCLAKTAKTKEQVQSLLEQGRQQQQGQEQQQSSATTASVNFDPAAAGTAALTGLVQHLQQHTDKWQQQLQQQVLPGLVGLLPTALLTAIELVYLGALPRQLQQQVLVQCKLLITKALDRTSSRVGSAAASLLPGGESAQTAAAAAAATQDGSARAECIAGGRCLLQLLKEGSSVAPCSALIGRLQLLQPHQPLWLQLQLAAAAAAVAAGVGGQPLLIADPWQLLGSVLGELGECSSCAVGASPEAWVVLTQYGDRCSCQQCNCKTATEACSRLCSNSASSSTATGVCSNKGLLGAMLEALAAGRNVCLKLPGISGPDQIELVQAAAARYRLLQLRVAASEHDMDTAAGSAGNLLSNTRRCTKTQTATSQWSSGRFGPCSASRASSGFAGPKLVIQVGSTAPVLPPELAGLCRVVDLGGTTHYSHPGPSNCGSNLTAGSTSLQRQMDRDQPQRSSDTLEAIQQECSEYLPEVVLRLVLDAVAIEAVEAAAAAAQEAEAAAEQLKLDESHLMSRLSQELTASSALPILLESLATSAAALSKAEAAAHKQKQAAAELTEKLVLSYTPLAQDLTACLMQHTGMEVIQQGSKAVQVQHLSGILPVVVVEAVVRRAAAAGSPRGVAEEQHGDLVMETCAAGSHQAVDALQQQLLLLTRQRATAPGGCGSSDLLSSVQQPDGYVLQAMLEIVPAAVPIAVLGNCTAAALAAIYEAAAAAGVPATSIRLLSGNGNSGSSGVFAPYTSQKAVSEGDCKLWQTILIEDSATDADVAAAAAQLLAAVIPRQYQLQISTEQCAHFSSSSSSIQAGCSSARHTHRVWIAAPANLAAAVAAYTHRSCVEYRPGKHAVDTARSISPNRLLLPGLAAHVISRMLPLQTTAQQLPAGTVQLAGRALNVTQALLVAALAAEWRLQQLLACSSGSMGGIRSQVVAAQPNLGPHDVLHMLTLLQHVAALAVAQHASEDHHNSNEDLDPGITLPKPFRHLTKLPVDLVQLQQLLHWAVFGPSCSSRQAWQLSKQALQERFTADRLGIRVHGSGLSCGGSGEVQVLGGCIADAREDAARAAPLLQQHLLQQLWRLGCVTELPPGCRDAIRGMCSAAKLRQTRTAECGFETSAAEEGGHAARHGSGCGGVPLGDAIGAVAAGTARHSGDENVADVDRAHLQPSSASTSTSAVDSGPGCLLPVGLSLRAEEMWALLVSRCTALD